MKFLPVSRVVFGASRSHLFLPSKVKSLMAGLDAALGETKRQLRSTNKPSTQSSESSSRAESSASSAPTQEATSYSKQNANANQDANRSGFNFSEFVKSARLGSVNPKMDSEWYTKFAKQTGIPMPEPGKNFASALPELLRSMQKTGAPNAWKAMLEHCQEAHARQVAREMGIDVKGIKFEHRGEIGTQQRVVALLDAPNATPKQLEALKQRVNHECPVSRMAKSAGMLNEVEYVSISAQQTPPQKAEVKRKRTDE